MGIRKNAAFLSAAEREAFARACVLMKADIVNPTAPAAQQYSRWDEFVAVHWMIQSIVVTPPVGPSTTVNFGHGGTGAYGFGPWHRYFLLKLEQRLQGYVPGVMLPYWDWTVDPVGTILSDGFLGPNGDAGTNVVSQGYFAGEAPGTGANAVPAPAWWPAALPGWRLPAAFAGIPANGSALFPGALRRNVGAKVRPTPSQIRAVMDQVTYPAFQLSLESDTGMHNDMHVWFGASNTSHMTRVQVSPFDPMFYLHHCNIDRLWAMWQADGHAAEYPVVGGINRYHLRDAAMYPWGDPAFGYASNNVVPGITAPDFSADGIVTAGDVLDHRALGYTYDTMPVIGVALDRTGSMNQTTPDPIDAAAPDVTKWEAAKRGVSAFLLDCETAYLSCQAYVTAGVRTFHSLPANDFASVFAGVPYGLVKSGGGYGSAAFDAAIVPVTASGGTPLADALTDVHATLVAAPYGGLPADEQRYAAFFTDGMLTSGSPLSSIPDGNYPNTAIFAMGFGTPADVDYPTLETIVDKGRAVTTQQVFHGENAGVIDKFFSQALAAAMGFTPVVDPLIELFAGEHCHVEFTATSADDAFFVTAQGMDFDDTSWSFHLVGPDNRTAYSSGVSAHGGHSHGSDAEAPQVVALRRNGRLSLMLLRNAAAAGSWVGIWRLMAAYRSDGRDGMVMLDVAGLLAPVAAGPVRGPRYARLLAKPGKRVAARSVPGVPRHRLDGRPVSTNRDDRQSASVVVNVYARTRLRFELTAEADGKLAVRVGQDVIHGAVQDVQGLCRLIGPTRDVYAKVRAGSLPAEITRGAALKGSLALKYDTGKVLARLESKDSKSFRTRDEELPLVSHHSGALHAHVKTVDVPGPYHFGVYVEGVYHPDAPASGHAGHVHAPDTTHAGDHGGEHDHGGGAPAACDCACVERFERLLSISVAVQKPAPKKKEKGKKK